MYARINPDCNIHNPLIPSSHVPVAIPVEWEVNRHVFFSNLFAAMDLIGECQNEHEHLHACTHPWAQRSLVHLPMVPYCSSMFGAICSQ
jgi:hypothetical protein